MVVHAPSQGSAAHEDYGADVQGDGWVVFAGILLMLLATMNIIEGIAAIGNAHFFVGNARYVIGDLNTWGWVALCLGLLQLIVGLGVFVRNQAARWAGVAVLSLGAVAQLLMMPAYPFWSLSLVAIAVAGVYGLAVYGYRLG